MNSIMKFINTKHKRQVNFTLCIIFGALLPDELASIQISFYALRIEKLKNFSSFENVTKTSRMNDYYAAGQIFSITKISE